MGFSLSSLPLWRLDPLSVLALSCDQREKLARDLRSAEEAADEDGPGRLLGDLGANDGS